MSSLHVSLRYLVASFRFYVSHITFKYFEILRQQAHSELIQNSFNVLKHGRANQKSILSKNIQAQ